MIGIVKLVNRFIANIPPIIEFGKEVFQHRVIDGFYAIIRLQILFSYIRGMFAPMN
jgi:hypothetical protein